jgi:RecB family exonuclease/inactivated superfamily I helicase
VITPRQTRLYRVANLRAFQRAIQVLTHQSDLSRLRNCAVIVPSAAAADQLRRTFENEALQQKAVVDRAVALPHIVTRAGWYDAMHARLPVPPRRLSDLEREVLLKSAARDIAGDENAAPFRLRAGLLVEMLSLYDDLRRRNVSVDRFESAMTEDLARDAASDRGAERLLRQTKFLAAAFRGYESRLAAAGRADEHALRTQLLQKEPASPLRQIVVTVGDRTGDSAGLWKADFDLLARLPRLEEIDIVATHETLAAGFFDRLQDLMPGFEDADLTVRLKEQTAQPDATVEAPVCDDGGRPVLVTSGDGQEERPFLTSRDREDELSVLARRIKGSSNAVLDRRAVVFKRPLPYVYLVRDVFSDGGIPYQTFDALPLAAEPYAAALDLVFECVASEFTREPLVALLSSPHFDFDVDGVSLARADVAVLNRALCDAAYFGGIAQLRQFAASATSRVARAARAAVAAADELQTLTDAGPPSMQLRKLLAFLGLHDRMPTPSDQLRERHLRARTAICAAIRELSRAHEQFDDSPVSLSESAAMIRRWIEGQTFAPRTGAAGLQVLDAQAARYGEFDELFIVGLVEGEWPRPSARSIFYPQSLMARFDWPDSRAALAGERAAFHDLVLLPRTQVTLSTFELENDSIVGPSVFLEDIDRLGLQTRPIADDAERIFVHEAITGDPLVRSAVAGTARGWLDLRAARSDSSAARFHGTGAPYKPATYAISALERYLKCPFLFYSERVLELKEDPEDEATLSPKDLGIFVHSVFQSFFEEWNRRGHRSIAPDNLPEAREIFREVVEPLLHALPEDEAAVQRTRLLGSAADEGLAEAVFQVEAEWRTPVAERLLEHPLSGEFEIESEEGPRRIALKGKADRIDLLADGTFRIIDYKLGYAPDRRLALQLPIYSVCALQHLRATRGKHWELAQAGYIAFGEDRSFVPMVSKGRNQEDVLQHAQVRLLTAIDGIERGDFPPTPAEVSQCMRCAYAAVCRKDYVGDV